MIARNQPGAAGGLKGEGAGTIRVLVISARARTIDRLLLALEPDRSLEIVATASNEREALEGAMKLRPDVVVLDVQLCGAAGGIETCRSIMRTSPRPVILVTDRPEDTEEGVAGMRAGAMTVLSKERVLAGPSGARRFQEQVRAFAGLPTVRLTGCDGSKGEARAGTRVLGVVVSTGGPTVLERIVKVLPATLEGPIMVALHIQPDFLSSVAEWLGEHGDIVVEPALPGATARPGCMYLAPTDWGLSVDRNFRMDYSPGVPPLQLGDHLLTSLAESFGSGAAGLVLTGMAADGSRGLAAIRGAGGRTAVQERSSCVVASMPSEALDYAEAELGIEELGPWVTEILVASRRPL